MQSTYALYSSALVLNDAEEDRTRLEYHIKSGDYFGMLATVLGFVEESLQHNCDTESELNQKELETLKKFRADLAYMNGKYRIEPKSEELLEQ